MNEEIKDISLSEFNLSLGEVRVLNMTRVFQVKKSMYLHGQLQPVIARLHHDDTYQLIDGFKRYVSAEELMMETLECRVLDIDLRQAKVLLLSYNRPHRSMEAWEEAMVLRDLQETHGMDQVQLSGLTGYSRSWVSRRLSLVEKMDEKVSSRIKMGSLTSSHARALVKLPRGTQEEVAGIIENLALTSRQSNTLVETYLKAKNSQQEEYILTHPENVFMEVDIEPELSDARLSSFGNELLDSTCNVDVTVQMACLKLQDRRLEALSESERMIIIPPLQHALESCGKFTELITLFQTCKTKQKDER